MSRLRFVTVDSVASPVMINRLIRVPENLSHFVNGALSVLSRAENFEEVGNMSATQTAGIFFDILEEYHMSTDILIGQVAMYMRDSLPSNVLALDGSTHSRVDYPSLYAILAANCIVDADTFVLPDMSARFPISVGVVGGSLIQVGDVGGEEEHTLTEAEIPSHSHTQSNVIFNVDVEPPLGIPDPSGAGIAPPTQTGSTGGGQAHNNIPPYFGLVFGVIAR